MNKFSIALAVIIAGLGGCGDNPPPDATLDSGITSSNGAANASLAICPT
jgi:hypothetical protein